MRTRNLVVDLQLAKSCEPGLNSDGDFDYTLTITNPFAPNGATLANCVISDPGATCDNQVVVGPIAADGSSVSVNCTSPNPENTATVSCDIVENPGQFINAVASGTCDDVEVDKQVSCDGGTTWNETSPRLQIRVKGLRSRVFSGPGHRAALAQYTGETDSPAAI